MTPMWMAPFARALQMAQGAAKGFDFSVVGIGLPLKKLQHLQYFLHIVQRVAKCVDDPIDFFDSHLDCGWRGQPAWGSWRQCWSHLRFRRFARFSGFSRLSRRLSLGLHRKWE